MRYLSLTVSPSEGSFHPVDSLLAESSEIYRARVLHINLLNDDTVMVLYSVTGDEESVDRIMDEHDDVLTYDLFPLGDDRHHVYVHLDRGEPVVTLLSLVNENQVIIDTPMEFTDDGLSVTVMGEQDTLREVIDEVPDAVDVSIEGVGDYTPEENRVLSVLTERQREVLSVAVEKGYYSMPRRATHEDVADALGCAPSTASEHIRKIEAKIMSELVD
ncbi:MAG: helix-turn-helix domain-containing protein [Halobacteria archaeon]|nr:helix-turn-helix domain-containing protein [Halobacteria archaeon]